MSSLKDYVDSSTLIIINGKVSKTEKSLDVEMHKESILPDDVALKILEIAIKKLKKHKYETHS